MRPDDPDATEVAVLDPLVGSVINRRYRVEFRIAEGGFGAIYRALDLDSGRDVALKLLHPKLTSDRAVMARFRREGAALAQLRDPHTVTAYEVGETGDGLLFIAMELLQGESLYSTFRQLGPLPWRRVCAIARAVCSSLAEAHALGIIHRDLKPANIHLEERGDERDYVKVLDFGIAKIVHGGALDNADLTHAGQMIGTFDYMPPEQMVGGECTGQSDIFTLGVVMYEMIAGRRPWTAQSAASMLANLVTKEPAPLPKAALVPPELERILERCLARKPTDRFADVGELAAELDRLLGADETRTRISAPATPATTDRMDAISSTPGIETDVLRTIAVDDTSTIAQAAPQFEDPTLADIPLQTRAPTHHPPPRAPRAPRAERAATPPPIPPQSAKPPRPKKKILSAITLPGVAPPKKRR